MSGQVEDKFPSFADDDTSSQSSSFGSLIMTPSYSDVDLKQPKVINNIISDLTDRIEKVAHRQGVISEREACLQTQSKELAEREEAIKMREQDANFESLSAVAKLRSALASLDVSDATEAIMVVFDWTFNVIERYSQRRLQQAETTASFDLPKAEDDAHSFNHHQTAQEGLPVSQDDASVSESVDDPEHKAPSKSIKSLPVNKDGAIGLPFSVLRKAASLPGNTVIHQVDVEIPPQIGINPPPKPLRVPSWWESFGKTSSSESETSTIPPPPRRTWPVKDVLAGPDVSPPAAIESQNKGKAPKTDETEISSSIKPKCTISISFPKSASVDNDIRPAPSIKLKFPSPPEKKSTLTVDIEPQKKTIASKLAGTSQGKNTPTKDSNKQSRKGTRTFGVPEVDSDQDSEADTPTAKISVESKKASTRGKAKENDATLNKLAERIAVARKHAETTSDGTNDKSNAVKLQHNKISSNVQEAPNDSTAFYGTHKPNFPSLESEWNNEVEQLKRDFDIGTRGFVRADGTILKMVNGNPAIVLPTADKQSCVNNPHRSGRSIGQEQNQSTSPFAFPHSQSDRGDGNASSYQQHHYSFGIPRGPQHTMASGKPFSLGQPTKDPSNDSASRATQAVVGKQAKHSDSGLCGRSPDTAKARGNPSFSFDSGPSAENANQGPLSPNPFAANNSQGDNSLFGPRPSSFKQGNFGQGSNVPRAVCTSGFSFSPSPFATSTNK